jgi:hypothetical protein
MTRLLLAVVLGLSLHAGSVAAATVSCSGLPGSISDPAGDAFSANAPDIVCIGAQAIGGSLVLRAAFAPGTFDPATTHISFGLDTDQSPATGFPGITSGNTDAAVIGTEYIISFGSSSNAGFAVVRPDPAFTVSGFGSVEFFDDGMVATILLSLLGDDDGLLNFKAVVQTELSPNVFTPIQDFASNVGLAPGTSVVVSEPATLSLFGIALVALGCGRRKASCARPLARAAA